MTFLFDKSQTKSQNVPLLFSLGWYYQQTCQQNKVFSETWPVTCQRMSEIAISQKRVVQVLKLYYRLLTTSISSYLHIKLSNIKRRFVHSTLISNFETQSNLFFYDHSILLWDFQLNSQFIRKGRESDKIQMWTHLL